MKGKKDDFQSNGILNILFIFKSRYNQCNITLVSGIWQNDARSPQILMGRVSNTKSRWKDFTGTPACPPSTLFH